LAEASSSNTNDFDDDLKCENYGETDVKNLEDFLDVLLKLRVFVQGKNNCVQYDYKENETVEYWAVDHIEANSSQCIVIVSIFRVKSGSGFDQTSPGIVFFLVLQNFHTFWTDIDIVLLNDELGEVWWETVLTNFISINSQIFEML
jgi:hypothetical protein